MTTHRLRIENDTGVGISTKTFLDDRLVHGLTGVEVRVGMDAPIRATLDMLVSGVHVATEAEALYRVYVVDPEFEDTAGRTVIHEGEGSDPVEALQSAIDKMKSVRDGS
jgi:hypothetical protein